LSQGDDDSLNALAEIISNFVLPDSQDPPTTPLETTNVPLIASSVGLNLLSPKWPKFVTPARITVAVPKVSVNENGDPVASKNQVGTSR